MSLPPQHPAVGDVYDHLGSVIVLERRTMLGGTIGWDVHPAEGPTDGDEVAWIAEGGLERAELV